MTQRTANNQTRQFPDQNQLSVITAVILLAYMLGRYISLPARLVEVETLGVVFTFVVSGQVIILLLVAALITTGSDALIRSHPASKGRLGPLRTVIHWILPGTTALGLGLLLNTPQVEPVWWLALLVTALFLVVVLIAEYVVVDKRDPAFNSAALGLSALTYLVALGLFAWLKLSGARASLAAGSTGFVALLFSLRLLQLRASLTPRMLINSAVVGVVVGEASWAINYWPVTPIGAGVVLLVVFYVTHGLAQQNVTQGPNRRVTLEYLLIGAAGLVLAALFALLG